MAQTEKFSRTFEKFEKAFNKYKEIVKSAQLYSFLSQDLIVEVLTKRFEYTFESMWQALKEYLRREGIDCSTPLKCFREAFKAGIIEEAQEGTFIEMIEKRNQMVHIYDSKRAFQIYEFVKSDVVFQAIETIYNKLKGGVKKRR